MVSYLLRRLLQSVFFIMLASLLIYTVLVMVMPGGPKTQFDRLYENYSASGVSVQEAIESGDDRLEYLVKQYKLDKPWPLNYLVWLFDPSDTTQVNGYFEVVPKGININVFGVQIQGAGMLTGDFGLSENYARGHVSVAQLIADRWDHTLLLILYSAFITVFLSLPLGVIGAIRHRKAPDHAIMFFSFTGLSMPPFVLGLLLIIFLSVFPAIWHRMNGLDWLPFLPPGGLPDRDSWGDRLYHMTLPAITLAIPQIAWLTRYTRFSMLEVLKTDYVRTAWAKGLARRRVIFRHALRNALLPMITLVGLAIPGIASTSIVVETVFGYQGLGQLLYRGLGGCLASASLLTQEPPPCPRVGYFPMDFPIALTMLTALVIVITLATVLADFLYTAADPRVDFRAKQRT